MGEPRILAINHGECENRVVDWVKVRLNMGIEKYSKKNGTEAIRIENLPELLKSKWLCGEQNLHSKYKNLEYLSKENPRMPNLRIFTIMDTEYELAHSNRSYITGNMFNQCYFQGRMTAIYNAPNMDRVFEKADIGKVSCKKPSSYTDILDSYEVMDLYEKLNGREDSNLSVFLGYCLSTRPEYQNKIRQICGC